MFKIALMMPIQSGWSPQLSRTDFLDISHSSRANDAKTKIAEIHWALLDSNQ